MTKNELIDKMIADIMEDFDFDRVQKTMVFLDWRWVIENGERAVPSSFRLMKQAESLLRKVASYYNKKDYYMSGTGGFEATLDGKTLRLQFVLTQTEADETDYE